jgi:hypothetical protein
MAECEARVAQCSPPPRGPGLAVPRMRGRAAEFDAYNEVRGGAVQLLNPV